MSIGLSSRSVQVREVWEVRVGEFAPVIGGLIAGFVLADWWCGTRHAIWTMAALSVIIALAVGWLNGELTRSLGFLLVDAPTAFVSQVAALMVAKRVVSAAGSRAS